MVDLIQDAGLAFLAIGVAVMANRMRRMQEKILYLNEAMEALRTFNKVFLRSPMPPPTQTEGESNG